MLRWSHITWGIWRMGTQMRLTEWPWIEDAGFWDSYFWDRFFFFSFFLHSSGLWLRELAVLTEELGSDPSTHRGLTAIHNSGSKRFDALLWPPWAPDTEVVQCTYAHKQINKQTIKMTASLAKNGNWEVTVWGGPWVTPSLSTHLLSARLQVRTRAFQSQPPSGRKSCHVFPL